MPQGQVRRLCTALQTRDVKGFVSHAGQAVCGANQCTTKELGRHSNRERRCVRGDEKMSPSECHPVYQPHTICVSISRNAHDNNWHLTAPAEHLSMRTVNKKTTDQCVCVATAEEGCSTVVSGISDHRVQKCKPCKVARDICTQNAPTRTPKTTAVNVLGSWKKHERWFRFQHAPFAIPTPLSPHRLSHFDHLNS